MANDINSLRFPAYVGGKRTGRRQHTTSREYKRLQACLQNRPPKKSKKGVKNPGYGHPMTYVRTRWDLLEELKKTDGALQWYR